MDTHIRTNHDFEHDLGDNYCSKGCCGSDLGKSNLGKTICRICGDSFPSNGEFFCPEGCHYGCACCEPPALQVDPDQVPDEPPNHQEVKNWDKEIESFVLKEAEKYGPHDHSLNSDNMIAQI